MKAGELKERILIQRRNNVQGDDGEFTQTTVDILNTFAKVNHRSNSLDFIANATDMLEFIEFTIRFRQDVILHTGDVIYWRERTLKIHSFPFSDDRTFFKILAKTYNNNTSVGS